MADWIEAGTSAPEFELTATDGSIVKLADLNGKPVVVYFYPKDDTPGCTIEACAFRDRSSELTELGATVLGISPDDVESHQAFTAKFDLNFPLLADIGHKVADAYGAWGEKVRNGETSMGIRRSTFVIDANGVVAKAWTTVNVEGHDAEVIAAIKELPAA